MQLTVVDRVSSSRKIRPATRVGPLDLLILQATPFCNLDCTYCYLPNRHLARRMNITVLEDTARRVFASQAVGDHFTIVWHAGEPMAMPISFYQQAIEIFDRHNTRGVRVRHSIQTNGTMIDQDWCDFIKANPVKIGVSVDGPAFIHDSCRKTRKGGGTFDRVIRGITHLRNNRIAFHVISVLTRLSLDYPDEMFNFYREHGINQVGFNVEEKEGPHVSSSLDEVGIEARYRQFLSRFHDLVETMREPMKMRELDGATAAILYGGDPATLKAQQTTPLSIVTVDVDGNFGTFSPELIDAKSDVYGDFIIGNVATDDLDEAAAGDKCQSMRRDIEAGIDRCRSECPYFGFCGGGVPSNKFFENGTFDSTQTMHCRLQRQTVMDLMLEKCGA
jgi:uncharacterized protein